MGTDKALVEFLGRPLIEHVAARVADVGQVETLLITNRPDDYAYLGLPMFGDVLPDKGSLGGIYTAIHASRAPYTLVVACDMPFVNPVLLRYMADLLDAPDGPFDVVVPRSGGYPEGLHAIYGKACLGPIRKRMDANWLKVIGFYDDVRVRYLEEAEYAPIDPEGRSFYNVNTPEELAQARRLADE